MRILLLFTSREGQTQKIMQAIASTLSQHDHQCDLIDLNLQPSVLLSTYQAVLIGTSIRYGYYSKAIKQFIIQHTDELNHIPSGFFGVNMVARKPHKNTPETNLYTRKFLDTIQWQPTIKAVFAGALYYPQYNWFDKNMIRFIMWLGKGDTDVTKPIIEYTDWEQVEKFSQQFLEMITPS